MTIDISNVLFGVGAFIFWALFATGLGEESGEYLFVMLLLAVICLVNIDGVVEWFGAIEVTL